MPRCRHPVVSRFPPARAGLGEGRMVLSQRLTADELSGWASNRPTEHGRHVLRRGSAVLRRATDLGNREATRREFAARTVKGSFLVCLGSIWGDLIRSPDTFLKVQNSSDSPCPIISMIVEERVFGSKTFRFKSCSQFCENKILLPLTWLKNNIGIGEMGRMWFQC